MLNFGTVYHGGGANTVNVPGYADPNTFAGQDPNPMLDADDEIAFMARDAGRRRRAVAPPRQAGGAPASRSRSPTRSCPAPRLRLPVPQAPGGARPRARARTTSTTSSSCWPGTTRRPTSSSDGPNPENSTVTTPYYQHHFADRWTSDSIKVTAPGASGVDILDRHKELFAPGNCGRSEDTFNDAEGAFIVNKDGPVRAIRSYIGANSGPNTQREHIFYDRREDVRTYLRVHAIPGIMDFFDYSPAASGMTYSQRHEPGRRHDRRRPGPPVAGAPDWEKVDGPQGSLTSVGRSRRASPPPTHVVLPRRLDAAAGTQCTGDAFAYGSSGIRITSASRAPIPATAAPTRSARPARCTSVRPGATAAQATALSNGVTQPLAATGTSWP